MARVSFWEVFGVNPDGSLEAKKRIKVGGVEFGPGIKFGRGVAFGGIDFSQYVGRDLEIEKMGDLVVVTGIY